MTIIHQMSRPAEVFEPQLVLAELTDLAPYVPVPLLCWIYPSYDGICGLSSLEGETYLDLHCQSYESRVQRLCECISGGGDVPSF